MSEAALRIIPKRCADHPFLSVCVACLTASGVAIVIAKPSRQPERSSASVSADFENTCDGYFPVPGLIAY